MCRLVAYLGQPLLLENVLVNPENSIVMQSLQAKESTIPTNGDGFGLGWYVPEISNEPALFTSILPAWSDRNLLNLTSKIRSGCFFAHVRAASEGGVTPYNCHPFVYGPWMFMHNGSIAGFKAVKRHLRHLLEDDIYHWIKGDTDSEHLFALFLQLTKGKNLSDLNVLTNGLSATLSTAFSLSNQYAEKEEPSFFNICLTDGHRLIATRWCSDPTLEPESLHYAKPKEMTEGLHRCMIISSERLNSVESEWHMVPPNSFLIIDETLEVKLQFKLFPT